MSAIGTLSPLIVAGFLTLAACSETPAPAEPGSGSPPVISLTLPSISFYAAPSGANPTPQIDSVLNSGGGTLTGLAVGGITYGAGQPTGWLGATLSATTAPAVLMLTAITGSLPPGAYTASVSLVGAGATNSPQNIPVTFTVSATPLIVIDLAHIGFAATAAGASPPAQVDSVRNGGAGTLSGLAVAIINYGSGQPMGWLSASLSATTAPAALTLTATTGSLAAGTYTATVYVTGSGATNSPQAVSVTFTVTALPFISLRQPSLMFFGALGGANPAAQTDSVFNGGGGTLSGLAVGAITYGMGQPAGWLSATLSATMAPAALTLTAALASLPAGTFTATVPVLSSVATNSPQTVTVTFIVSPSSFSSVSAGQYHTCALTMAGAAYCWGAGRALGNGTENGSLVPVAVSGGFTFTGVSASAQDACAVTPAGAAYCWGENPYGELGDGTKTTSLVPVAVTGGLSFASVSAGNVHTCGVTVAGAGYCWGALPGGNTSTPSVVTGGLTFASISAGYYHMCGLTTSGAAYCWGQGPLGNGLSGGSATPVAVVGGLTFTAISAGEYYACGVTGAGIAYCWGENFHGELGDGTDTTRLSPVPVSGGLGFASISAGSHHTCGLTAAGVPYCWGLNNYGEIGDGSVTARSKPAPVAGGLTLMAISAGMENFNGGGAHTCGITPAGAVYCWGYNGEGELGEGTTTTSLVPVRVQ